MVVISSRQIRAARALLDWKQADLAQRTGLSLTALNNIEHGAVSSRTGTLQRIQAAFMEAGVEFTEGDGVRLRTEIFNVQTIEGKTVLRDLLDDIVDTLRKNGGGETLWSGVDESDFIRAARREAFDYYTTMQENGFRERVILSEKDKTPYAPRSVTEYRALPADFFGDVNFGVCGDKYYMTIFGRKPRLIIIEHKGVAEIQTRQFNALWKTGRFVSYTGTLYDAEVARLNGKQPSKK